MNTFLVGQLRFNVELINLHTALKHGFSGNAVQTSVNVYRHTSICDISGVDHR